MLCRKKPTLRRRRVRKLAVICLAAIIFLIAYFETAVKSQLSDVIVRDMRTLSQQAITMAAEDFLAENPDIGEKLCRIRYHDGTVAAISADTPSINSVKTEITRRAQKNIDTLSHTQGVATCLGSLTGLVILADAGPEVRFSVESTQTVSCEFKSSFESAGINQTVHHIIMTVSVDLLICNPFRIHKTVSTTSSFEIAQTVIVGSVPSYSGIASAY